MHLYRRIDYFFRIIAVAVCLTKSTLDTLFIEKNYTELQYVSYTADSCLAVLLLAIILLLVQSVTSIKNQTIGCAWKNHFIINLTLFMAVLMSMISIISYLTIMIATKKYYAKTLKTEEQYQQARYLNIWYLVYTIYEPLMTVCQWIILYSLYVFSYNQPAANIQNQVDRRSLFENNSG